MKVRVETPGGEFWAYEHRWEHWDGHNLTSHSVRSPLFDFFGSNRELAAHREYLRLLEKKFRQFPPCDKSKVLEQLAKRKDKKA